MILVIRSSLTKRKQEKRKWLSAGLPAPTRQLVLGNLAAALPAFAAFGKGVKLDRDLLVHVIEIPPQNNWDKTVVCRVISGADSYCRFFQTYLTNIYEKPFLFL